MAAVVGNSCVACLLFRTTKNVLIPVDLRIWRARCLISLGCTSGIQRQGGLLVPWKSHTVLLFVWASGTAACEISMHNIYIFNR